MHGVIRMCLGVRSLFVFRSLVFSLNSRLVASSSSSLFLMAPVMGALGLARTSVSQVSCARALAGASLGLAAALLLLPPDPMGPSSQQLLLC